MNRAYLDALRMLGRRDLSERQLRQRLSRKEHPPGDIEQAIERLRAERALDDGRVAEGIARTESSVKRRGRLRALRQIEGSGIDRDTARRAVDEVFGALDADALLEAALARRLRGRETIEDDKEYQRLYRYLLGQGFESDRIGRALRVRRKR